MNQKIKSVCKLASGIVFVLDENGDRIPQYQGPYNWVKTKILSDAPSDAEFVDGLKPNGGWNVVSREAW